MAAPKGHRIPNAPVGRKPGTQNKVNALLKDQILQGLAQADPKGAVEYFRIQALKEPVAFMGLLGKILPTQIAGEGGGPIMIVTGVPRDGE